MWRRACWPLAGAALIAGCTAERAPSHEAAAAPSPFVTRVLSDSTYRWATVIREGMRVHAMEGTYAARHIAAIADSAFAVRTEMAERLGVDAVEHGEAAHLFLLADREDFKPIVGQRAGGWTEPAANAILAVAGEAEPPPLRHEFAHLLSHRRWGRPRTYWLSEGVAVFAVGHCAGKSLHAWALAAREAGDPLTLQSLVPFDFSRAAPHLIAGSFVQHVAERHGIDAVRVLWTEGLPASHRATGLSAEALEAEWVAHLETVLTSHDPRGMDVSGIVRCETG
jgi:hypothetical protein